MYIKKRRIRNPKNYLKLFDNGVEFYVSALVENIQIELLEQIGFSSKLLEGELVLPNPSGTISDFNANGTYNKLKHLPKETAYRQAEWKWNDWGGNEHSKIVDIPYQRYQREFIPPPSEELSITHNSKGVIIVSKILINNDDSLGEISHLINLFLELFGECELVSSNLEAPFKPETIRLNWEILPPGEYPWAVVKERVANRFENQPEGNKVVITDRLETIDNYMPDFCAIGNGGFGGYMVFGFPDSDIYILESIYNNNATYVFQMIGKRFQSFLKER